VGYGGRVDDGGTDGVAERPVDDRRTPVSATQTPSHVAMFSVGPPCTIRWRSLALCTLPRQ
jgi:hypothetical protein